MDKVETNEDFARRMRAKRGDEPLESTEVLRLRSPVRVLWRVQADASLYWIAAPNDYIDDDFVHLIEGAEGRLNSRKVTAHSVAREEAKHILLQEGAGNIWDAFIDSCDRNFRAEILHVMR